MATGPGRHSSASSKVIMYPVLEITSANMARGQGSVCREAQGQKQRFSPELSFCILYEAHTGFALNNNMN